MQKWSKARNTTILLASMRQVLERLSPLGTRIKLTCGLTFQQANAIWMKLQVCSARLNMIQDIWYIVKFELISGVNRNLSIQASHLSFCKKLLRIRWGFLCFIENKTDTELGVNMPWQNQIPKPNLKESVLLQPLHQIVTMQSQIWMNKSFFQISMYP